MADKVNAGSAALKPKLTLNQNAITTSLTDIMLFATWPPMKTTCHDGKLAVPNKRLKRLITHTLTLLRCMRISNTQNTETRKLIKEAPTCLYQSARDTTPLLQHVADCCLCCCSCCDYLLLLVACVFRQSCRVPRDELAPSCARLASI